MEQLMLYDSYELYVTFTLTVKLLALPCTPLSPSACPSKIYYEYD